MSCTTWKKRFGRISVCPRGGNVSVSGHAVGQGQASLGSSPLPLAAFPGSDQSEANRGGHSDINPAEGSHTKLRPQTRVRTRTRMAGKDGRMRWTVKCIFKCLASSRISPSCPSSPPLSALALGPCVSQFQLAALAPGVLQLRGREGGRGQASSPLPHAWRRACLC